MYYSEMWLLLFLVSVTGQVGSVQKRYKYFLNEILT